jgi:hypothetical protein
MRRAAHSTDSIAASSRILNPPTSRDSDAAGWRHAAARFRVGQWSVFHPENALGLSHPLAVVGTIPPPFHRTGDVDEITGGRRIHPVIRAERPRSVQQGGQTFPVRLLSRLAHRAPPQPYTSLAVVAFPFRPSRPPAQDNACPAAGEQRVIQIKRFTSLLPKSPDTHAQRRRAHCPA